MMKPGAEPSLFDVFGAFVDALAYLLGLPGSVVWCAVDETDIVYRYMIHKYIYNIYRIFFTNSQQLSLGTWCVLVCNFIEDLGVSDSIEISC